MSRNTVPYNDREHKARELAADPKAIYQVTPSLYLVHSQNHTFRYYEVCKIESGWTCTCPDHRKTARRCKHIMALQTILAAREDLARWTTRRGWTQDETIQRIETRMGAGDLDDREMLMLIVYRNAAQLPVVAFALRYYWPDYHPENLLDPVYGNYQPEPADVDVKTPQHWTEWRPIDNTVAAIRDYIEEEALTHGPVYITETRRVGRWEGSYNLIMLTAQAA